MNAAQTPSGCQPPCQLGHLPRLSEHISAIPIERGRDPVIGDIVDMLMMSLLSLNCQTAPFSCGSCRAGQIPAAVAPVGAPRNGEGRMLRKSAVAAAIAMLFALPVLAQNPPAAPPVRVRGTIENVDGANFTVKARDGMDVKVAVTDATRIQSLVKKSLADIEAGDFLASTGMKARTASCMR